MTDVRPSSLQMRAEFELRDYWVFVRQSVRSWHGGPWRELRIPKARLSTEAFDRLRWVQRGGAYPLPAMPDLSAAERRFISYGELGR